MLLIVPILPAGRCPTSLLGPFLLRQEISTDVARHSHAPLGSTKPAAGVIVARPAIAPTQRPIKVGRPSRIHSILHHRSLTALKKKVK